MTKLLHFVNCCSDETVYIGLWLREERLEIHIYNEPGQALLEIRPLQRLSINATAEIETCIHNGQLQYTIVGHCDGVWLRIPTTAKPDGPVFKFYNSSLVDRSD
ncbi:hypothetical protein KKE28_02245 [Patescibacteria group bacterium]|nr:hypothetical protein [Patescibacteria group bacterium]